MRLSSSSERGRKTQTDKFWNRTEKLTIIAYRNIIRTPISSFPPEDPTKIVKTEQTNLTPEEKELQDHTTEFFTLLDKFVTDLVESSGGKTLFETIHKTTKIENLPENYKRLIHYGTIIMAHHFYNKFHVEALGEQRIATLHKIYSLIPFSALATCLTYANPLKLLRAILDLFLLKPLGRRNLAQRLVKVVLQQREGEETQPVTLDGHTHPLPSLTLKELQKKINNHKVCEKVHAFVNQNVEVLPPRSEHVHDTISHRVEKVLKSNVAPELPSNFYSTLSPETKIYVYHLILQETRMRDFEQISELLGDDKVIAIMKELISIFFSPLITIYQQADISTLFGSISHILKNILEIADKAKQHTRHDLIEQYQRCIESFEVDFYTFLHKSVEEDIKGEKVLSHLVDWLMKQMVFFKKKFITIRSKFTSNNSRKFKSARPN